MAITRISNDGIVNYSHYNKMSGGAVVGADPRFIIMGSDSYIYSSNDGITWTKKGIPNTGGNQHTVAKYNNKYYAGRSDGVFVSSDLITWTYIANDEAVDIKSFDGSMYTLVNDSSFTRSALRGPTFRQTNGEPNVPISMAWNGVDKLVTVGNRSSGSYYIMVKSLTPATLESPPVAATGVGSPVAAQHLAVAYGNGAWVTATNTNLIYSTDNAASWTSSISNLSWGSLVFANGLFVAGGYEGIIATSTNGSTWTTRLAAGGTTSIRSIAYGNGMWVACDANLANAIYTSTNGTTWTARTFGFAGITAQKVFFQ